MSLFDEGQKVFWEKRTSNVRPHSHPIVRAFTKQRAELVAKWMEGRVFESALDVGCGDGFGMCSLQELVPYIFGCDGSLGMLRGNPVARGVLCQANAYTLPFADASFDLVYCWELLHHVCEPVRVVKEMARVSSRHVMIFEPNSLNLPMMLYGIISPEERGLLRFTPWYLKQLLIQAGIRPLKTLTGGCFTPNYTPEWLFTILKRMPYTWPLVGISNIVLAEVPFERKATTHET